MSLRGRLTLLYTSPVGGILLLFGVVVFVSVSLTLTRQVDETLRRVAEVVRSNLRVDSYGDLHAVSMLSLDLPADVFVQVWNRDGQLSDATQNIIGFSRPLDPVGLQAWLPDFRVVTAGEGRLRVLSVPLAVGGRRGGALQVAKPSLLWINDGLTLHVALWLPITALGAYYLAREGIKWSDTLRAEVTE